MTKNFVFSVIVAVVRAGVFAAILTLTAFICIGVLWFAVGGQSINVWVLAALYVLFFFVFWVKPDAPRR